MNTLQQVIKRRQEDFEEKFDEKIKYVNYCLSEGEEMLDINDIKSHNQETVVAILEAMKEWVRENWELDDEDMKIASRDHGKERAEIEAKMIMTMTKSLFSYIDSTLQDIKNNK